MLYILQLLNKNSLKVNYIFQYLNYLIVQIKLKIYNTMLYKQL